MADAGDLNKSNGDIFFAEDVTAIMNVVAKTFKNQAQLIFNARREGINSDLGVGLNLFNTDYIAIGDGGTLSTDSATDIPVVGSDASTDKKAYFAKFLDDFGDSSIDSNIWSQNVSAGGSLVENGNLVASLSVGSATEVTNATADQSSGEDYKALAGNSVIYIPYTYNITRNSSSGSIGVRVQLTDGSNDVDISSVSRGSDGTSNGTNYVKIIINKSGETCDVYVNGSLAQNDLSLASLSNYYLRIEAFADGLNGGGSGGTISVPHVAHLLGDGATADLVFSAPAASETIRHAILVVNDDPDIGSNSDHTYYLSADNGSNYEEVTPNQIHVFTNTGTELKIKVTGTMPDSISASTEDQASEIYEVAVAYNLY